MAIVRFVPGERQIDVGEGTDVRRAALDADVQLYSGVHRVLNCRGKGRCTGCMVRVADGSANASSQTPLERLRLLLSRGAFVEGARLACQTKVHGDVVVETGVSPFASIRALVQRFRRG